MRVVGWLVAHATERRDWFLYEAGERGELDLLNHPHHSHPHHPHHYQSRPVAS